MSRKILLVDDDPHLRDVVLYALQREGFAVEAAVNGLQALEFFGQRGPFDLVVLDVMMPELDGLEVCRRLRQGSRVPIVFLSSRDEEIDKILGLELGGDDYVTKPFSVRELLARVKAVLRRLSEPAPAAGEAPALLTWGPIRLDPARHEVSCGEAALRLTVTEFGLLLALMERPGRVLSRGQLMEVAYSYDNLITERTIDTHVKRIRKKFRDAGHDPIETVYGLGYKLRA
ncbi:MAG: response regulator transcription factor [Polyangiaceae bacterium]|jgi:two-component system OmpR family response regulator|nr:response regulator transcription factor [Polyangiaceae bacterium]